MTFNKKEFIAELTGLYKEVKSAFNSKLFSNVNNEKKEEILQNINLVLLNSSKEDMFNYFAEWLMNASRLLENTKDQYNNNVVDNYKKRITALRIMLPK